jgi:hypothetical protein
LRSICFASLFAGIFGISFGSDFQGYVACTVTALFNQFKRKIMSINLNLVLLASTVALLSACGGGGGGGDSGSGGITPTANPLAKYEGTYYFCDGHSRETMTVTAQGESSLSFTVVEDIHRDNNCTGPVVGTYRLPLPFTGAFVTQTTATLPPATVFPFSATVDRISLSSQGMTAQLSGSGVRGACVYYTNGNVCYDSLESPAATITGGLYQSGNYLVTFTLENGVLETDAIYSKDPLFNYNSLVRD